MTASSDRPPACRLCGSRDPSREFTSANGYPILRCASCGLVFTDDRRAPPAASLYRAGNQSGRRFARKIGWMLQLFLEQRVAFVKQVAPGGRLLDFGCGDGAFAQQAWKAGFEVVGLDPFSLGAAVSEPRLELLQAPWEDVRDRLGTFDVITLWHVLEHMDDPAGLLRQLTPYLSPGGSLVVSVPNFASLQSRVFRGRWFHLDPPRHLSHFEHATLDRCLEGAGLRRVTQRNFLPEYGSSGWVQSPLNVLLPHTNYLYELVKDRGALQRMAPVSSALHFAASMALAAPLFAASLPMEAIASAQGGGAALTFAARRL